MESELESKREREGEYVVVSKRTYCGALKSESRMKNRNERKEWKSPGKETIVETRLKMKEGMREGKSVKRVVLDKLKGEDVEIVEGIWETKGGRLVV